MGYDGEIRIDKAVVARGPGDVLVVKVTSEPPVLSPMWEVWVEGAWASRALAERWQAEAVAARLMSGGETLADLVVAAKALRAMSSALIAADRAERALGEDERASYERLRETCGVACWQLMAAVERRIAFRAANGRW